MTRSLTRLEHRLAETVCQVCDPLAILMFGSRARGQAGPKSDADLLVVVEDAPTGLADEIKDALSFLPVGVDVVLRTPDQMRTELANPAGFLSSILSGAFPLVLRNTDALEPLLVKVKTGTILSI